MIVIFGPAGAGKSIQGQMLAAKNGWKWLSMGQLLRDSNDPELTEIMRRGELVPFENTFKVMKLALGQVSDFEHVVLDGFPRQIEQAKWLVENSVENGREVCLAIILDVPRNEIIKRLSLRGRDDDTPKAIDERLEIYKKEIHPIIDYFASQNIQTITINGLGTMDEVHDRIIKELEKCNLVQNQYSL